MKNEPQIFTRLQRQDKPVDPDILLDLEDEQLMSEVRRLLETRNTKQITVGNHSMNVEVVSTPESRRKGLMHRQRIGSDGMLFVMDESPASFHMANTYIPLDIIYFDASGQVVKIDSMKPKIGRSRCDVPVSHALEVPAGTCRKMGIGVGDKLMTESLLHQIVREFLR